MPSRQPVDLVIEARWVLPIAPENSALAGHAVAVSDGRIVALGPAAELRERYAPQEHVVRDAHALLPGFVNAHTRAATVLLRGLPVRAPRLRWLRETLAPAEERWLSPDFVHDGTRLAIAEMLRAGITAFGDAYLFPEEVARAAAAARVRAAVGLPVADATTPWAENATEHLAKCEALWDEYRSHPWVSLHFAPQAPYCVEDATLTRVRRVADELDARIAMQLHETEVEVRDSLARYGRRPLQRLADLGLLRPGFTAINLNRLDESDLELITRTGIACVVCPQSDLRLGDGPSSLAQLVGRGVSVGLGTDGAAGTGALDVLAEARTASLTSHALATGRPALAAQEVMRLATLGGASALGLSHLIGSIEPGKAADLVCIDLSPLACQPDADPFDAIVFAATRQQVSDVWVAGRAAVAEGRLIAFDEQELLALARLWARRVQPGAAA